MRAYKALSSRALFALCLTLTKSDQTHPQPTSPSDAAGFFSSPLLEAFDSCAEGEPDLLCDVLEINRVNKLIYPQLKQLSQTKFFRYTKINLYKQCKFWDDAQKCATPFCAVESAEPDPSLPHIYQNTNLGDLSFDRLEFGSQVFGICDTSKKDFFVFDDHLNGSSPTNAVDPDELIVDYVQNPERYTGYVGDDARRVWQKIYDLCGDLNSDQCLEEKVYYRLVSGFHASVNMHVCRDFLFKSTGTWGPNFDCFMTKFGQNPERIRNIYLVYAIMLRASVKAKSLLKSYDYCEDVRHDESISSQIEDLTETAGGCNHLFDESKLFHDDTNSTLKEEFRNKFRTASEIMDCVSCTKCRLWGKTQIAGLATALKILFSYDERELDHAMEMTTRDGQPLFKPFEILTFVNTFHRFAESVHDAQVFTEQLRAIKTRVSPLEGSAGKSKKNEANPALMDSTDKKDRNLEVFPMQPWTIALSLGVGFLPVLVSFLIARKQKASKVSAHTQVPTPSSARPASPAGYMKRPQSPRNRVHTKKLA